MALQESSKIHAAILAGGMGSRLRSVVPDRQKVIAHVGGKPFLSLLLDQARSAGILNVVLCTGYLGDQVRATLGDTYLDVQLSYSQETSPLGTGGALRHALPLIGSETVLVMNGDSYCDVDLVKFLSWHDEVRAEASMVLVEMVETGRYGRVEVGPGDRVLRFEEKSPSKRPGLINAGVYLFSRRLLSEIQEDAVFSLERDLFPAWLQRGVYGYRGGLRFIDIGTPDSFRSAQSLFGSSRAEWVLS
jgi:NDP-sugar pyrophosphorylase family protein